MTQPLTEAQLESLRQLPTAKPGDVFAGEDLPKYEVQIAAYLGEKFHVPEDGFPCRGCGMSLSGLLGTFTWGIVHGEGYCSHCLMPVRMYHRIMDGDEEVMSFTLPLQYHASGLSVRTEGSE